ncbi:MAG: molybdenum hydroxylase, partial [Chloroflexota bacterium]
IADQLIAEIQSEIEVQKSEIASPFTGILRGLIRDGLYVSKGVKIGDIDARDDVSACYLVSDKALAIGGGVLEAILSKEEIRTNLYQSHRF